MVQRSAWFRAALAALCVAAQLAVLASFARVRFGMPWNAAPETAPLLASPRAETLTGWNRLVVARWDSLHYENLALRGYAQCPAATRRTSALPAAPTMTCDLAFYPGYSLVGWLVSLGGRIPIDYALLLVSLASSWVFYFVWTSREIVDALGVRATLIALACFNLFTTGFTTVTIQTEPLLLGTTLAAFVLAQRGRLVAAALAAGAATGVRVTGAATGLAFAAFLALALWRERPVTARAWVRGLVLAALGFWGLAAMLAYDGLALGDPLIYIHAHQRSFGHRPSLGALLAPDPSWLLRSFTSPLHEGAILAAGVLWFALGHREAMARFSPPARAFSYALVAGALGISMLGSVSRGFEGMNRYLIAAVPIFFAMGKLLERRRLALLAWLGLSFWHYWNVDLCLYVGGAGAETVRRCQQISCN
jgi:hypothetical protein